MKKIFSALLLYAMAVGASAQSLQKGNMVFGLGTGLGIYRTTITDKTNTGMAPDKDTSGAFIFPLTFEYGVLNWLGAGARIGYHNYIEGKDSTNTNQKARGMDLMGCVNLHFLRSKHVDMFVSSEFGYSSFKYTVTVTNTTTTYGAMAIASGTGYSFGLNTRFYFGKSAAFGLHLSFALEGFNYQNGEISDDIGSPATQFRLKGNGKVFGIGLQYKI